MVPSKEVQMISGTENLKCFTQTHVLGAQVSVYFCGICGTCLYKQLHTPPFDQCFVVQSGTLDEVDGKLGADLEPPDGEGYPELRAAWLPAVEGLPDVQKVQYPEYVDKIGQVPGRA